MFKIISMKILTINLNEIHINAFFLTYSQIKKVHFRYDRHLLSPPYDPLLAFSFPVQQVPAFIAIFH